MGSVTPEKAGQASGVLSSFRQIGSVLGIAVMGAVLQNRAGVYIQNGVAARLDAAPFPIPSAAKQAIVDAVGAVSATMGDLRGGEFGVGIQLPSGVTDLLDAMPDSMAEKVVAFFRELLGIDYILGEFARGMRTAYFFSIVLMVAGGLLALAVSGRVKKTRATRPE